MRSSADGMHRSRRPPAGASIYAHSPVPQQARASHGVDVAELALQSCQLLSQHLDLPALLEMYQAMLNTTIVSGVVQCEIRSVQAEFSTLVFSPLKHDTQTCHATHQVQTPTALLESTASGVHMPV